jgi:hypothetical protein
MLGRSDKHTELEIDKVGVTKFTVDHWPHLQINTPLESGCTNCCVINTCVCVVKKGK